MEINNKQRKEYLSWDEFFMGVAILASERSKDPNTQVGACIVSSDNRILSVGYNGTPNGFEDIYFPWDREGDELNTKYLYVVHAERNAILNYRGNIKDFEGAKLYVTMFPCNECAKEVIQVGIKDIIYLDDKYANTNGVIASKRMLDVCNVKYSKLGLNKSKIKVLER
ncbi:MAG: deoxycytidylate deaminase [Bacilli bacterium]